MLAVVECKLAEALVVAAVTGSGGQGFGSRVAARGKKQKPKEPEVSPQARLPPACASLTGAMARRPKP